MPRKGENIYKRRDGRWEGRYIKEYDSKGKAKYGYVYAKSYLKVKNDLIERKAGADAPLKKETGDKLEAEHIAYFAESWLNDINTRVKQSTYVKYSNIIKNHIQPFLGEYKVSEIDTELIRDFIERERMKGNLKTGAGLSAKSIRDIISVLKLLLKHIKKKGIDVNCSFDSLKLRSDSRLKGNNLNKAAQLKLTNYLLEKTDNVKLGILICLYAGLRIGEICAVKFGDISFSDNLIHVNKTMQRVQNLSKDKKKKTEVIITSPKSLCSYRDIPLPDFVIQSVKKLYSKPEDFLLTGSADKFIEPRTMENKFQTCLKECGIERVSFHQLRHRFATYCVELGFEVKILSEILGHSSVNITLNRYVHSSMEMKESNMRKIQKDMFHQCQC